MAEASRPQMVTLRSGDIVRVSSAGRRTGPDLTHRPGW